MESLFVAVAAAKPAVRAFPTATEGRLEDAAREIRLASRPAEDNDHFHRTPVVLAAACVEKDRGRHAVCRLWRAVDPGMQKRRGALEYEPRMAVLKIRRDHVAAGPQERREGSAAPSVC
jgi:hypothetical protein